MKRMIKRYGIPPFSGASNDVLKKTALIYLRDALLEEQYESCTGLVAAAKEFGATTEEIGYLLEDPRREPE